MNKYRKRIIAVLLIAGLALYIRAYIISIESITTLNYKPQRMTLIIDAGHGGADGGATVNGVHESIINLNIALKLDDIMGLFAVPVVLTRDREDIVYPEGANTIKQMKRADQESRIKLINSTDNAVLISIHQNKFQSIRANGAQVFYGVAAGSEQLALNAQDFLKRVLDPENKRLIKPIDEAIYLMRSAKCPAILIECGFLSNPGDLYLLQQDEYQIKIATAIAAAYLGTHTYLEELNGKS